MDLTASVLAGLLAALLIVTGYCAWMMRAVLASAMEPEVECRVAPGSEDLVITNAGPGPVRDLAVTAEAVTFIGPPWTAPAVRTPGRPGAEEATPPWWALDRLGPGETRTRPLTDLVERALRQAHFLEEAKKQGRLSGFSPKEDVSFFTFLLLRLRFRRDVDRKRFAEDKTICIGRDPRNGKRVLWDADRVAPPLILEVLRTMRDRP